MGGAKCGDSKVESVEQCDDGNTRDGTAATVCACSRWLVLPTPGAACKRTVCGDKMREGLEQCDGVNLTFADTLTVTRQSDTMVTVPNNATNGAIKSTPLLQQFDVAYTCVNVE
jgi:cysteine-rich repeat protein